MIYSYTDMSVQIQFVCMYVRKCRREGRRAESMREGEHKVRHSGKREQGQKDEEERRKGYMTLLHIHRLSILLHDCTLHIYISVLYTHNNDQILNLLL